ncbi:MAG: hypothetical protein ACKO7W_09140 [Elainella sp.]
MKICPPLFSTVLLLGLIAPASAQMMSQEMPPSQPTPSGAKPESPLPGAPSTAADLGDPQALRIVPRLGLNHTSRPKRK